MAEDDIPDKATTPIQREAFRRAEGDEGEAQRILFELREQGWTPEQEDSTGAREPSGGPPGGSETIQDGQPRESGSDRLTDSPVASEDTQNGPTGARPPTGGPPGGSETIQDGQQRDSGSDRVGESDQEDTSQPTEQQDSAQDTDQTDEQPDSGSQGPTTDELEGVNLNELSPEQAQEIIGEEFADEQYQGDFASSRGLDEQRQATGSPVRPTDPQFEAEATLPQLAAAVSNPTIDPGQEGRIRLAQQSPVELAALGLSGGEIRSVSPAIDTSDDLQREANFRETFSESEAQAYLQERDQRTEELRNRPGPTERQATDEQAEQLQSIEQEAADAFDEQLAGIDIGTGDVQLEQTSEGIRPTLISDVQREAQQEQLTQAREDIASQLSQREGVSVDPENVTFDFASGEAQIDEQTESEILQDRREDAAAAIRQQAGPQTQATGLDALETTGGEIGVQSRLANIEAGDLQVTDGELQLENEVRRELAAIETGLDPEDFNIRATGELQLDPATEVEQREAASEAFAERYRDRQLAEEAVAQASAGIEGAADTTATAGASLGDSLSGLFGEGAETDARPPNFEGSQEPVPDEEGTTDSPTTFRDAIEPETGGQMYLEQTEEIDANLFPEGGPDFAGATRNLVESSAEASQFFTETVAAGSDDLAGGINVGVDAATAPLDIALGNEVTIDEEGALGSASGKFTTGAGRTISALTIGAPATAYGAGRLTRAGGEFAAENPTQVPEATYDVTRQFIESEIERAQENPFEYSGEVVTGALTGYGIGKVGSTVASSTGVGAGPIGSRVSSGLRRIDIGTRTARRLRAESRGIRGADTSDLARDSYLNRLLDTDDVTDAPIQPETPGTGGTGSLLDPDTVDEAQGVSDPSFTSRVRGAYNRRFGDTEPTARQIETSRQTGQAGERSTLGELFPDEPDLPLREQIQEAGGVRRYFDVQRQRLAEADVESRAGAGLAPPRIDAPSTEDVLSRPAFGRDFDPSRSETLSGSPRDRISDDISDRALERRRQAEGTFDRGDDPVAGQPTRTFDPETGEQRDIFGDVIPERQRTPDVDVPARRSNLGPAGAQVGGALDRLEQAQQREVVTGETELSGEEDTAIPTTDTGIDTDIVELERPDTRLGLTPGLRERATTTPDIGLRTSLTPDQTLTPTLTTPDLGVTPTDEPTPTNDPTPDITPDPTPDPGPPTRPPTRPPRPPGFDLPTFGGDGRDEFLPGLGESSARYEIGFRELFE